MSIKSFVIAGLAGLALAAPAAAQVRGTMEFGAFGSGARFEKELGMEFAYGGGGRVGMFLDRRWALEFEKGEMRASRPNGLRDVNVGILSSRIVASDFQRGQFTALVGVGGGISTETNFLHSYGFDALIGMKYRLGSRSNLRLDLVHDVLANNGWKSYTTLRMGLGWLRHPDATVTK
jgi:hypothetical protein